MMPEPKWWNGCPGEVYGDDWKQPDAGPTQYACLDCCWRGKGAIARADHWRQTRHQTVYADDPRVTR